MSMNCAGANCSSQRRDARPDVVPSCTRVDAEDGCRRRSAACRSAGSAGSAARSSAVISSDAERVEDDRRLGRVELAQRHVQAACRPAARRASCRAAPSASTSCGSTATGGSVSCARVAEGHVEAARRSSTVKIKLISKCPCPSRATASALRASASRRIAEQRRRAASAPRACAASGDEVERDRTGSARRGR